MCDIQQMLNVEEKKDCNCNLNKWDYPRWTVIHLKWNPVFRKSFRYDAKEQYAQVDERQWKNFSHYFPHPRLRSHTHTHTLCVWTRVETHNFLQCSHIMWGILFGISSHHSSLHRIDETWDANAKKKGKTIYFVQKSQGFHVNETKEKKNEMKNSTLYCTPSNGTMHFDSAFRFVAV